MKLRRNSGVHKLLKYLALGSGLLVVSIISPQSGERVIRSIINSYFRRKRFERDRFLRDLKSLQARELIDWRDLGNGKVKITLTKKGKKKMLVYQLDDIQLKKPTKWDGKWRLITFDIPHSKKKERDALRRKLLDLGFYPLQKSVFITPYPCEDEIDFIASVLDVRRFILILYVSNFEGQEKLKHHFGL